MSRTCSVSSCWIKLLLACHTPSTSTIRYPDRIPGPAPCVTFSGKLGGLSVNLVWNGKCTINGVDNVGTVPASLSTYLAIQAIKPDLVISAGTAGGFKAQVWGSVVITLPNGEVRVMSLAPLRVWQHQSPTHIPVLT